MNTRLIPIPFIIMAAGSVLALPTITRQPTDFSVSLGANVTHTVTSSGIAPLTYQWRFNDLALNLETNRSLVLTNVQSPHGGNYAVVVADSSGSVTSRVARLTVDLAFTKITTGSIATDRGEAWTCAWGDYDHNGFIDLVVGRTGFSLLYKNNGDGSFSKITNNITTVRGDPTPIWGDYDNDGFLDLLMSEVSIDSRVAHRLYRNNGDGTFARITNGTLVTDTEGTIAAAWSDYDNDGFLDLMLGKFNYPKSLYRNNGDGTFRRMVSNEIGDLAVDTGKTAAGGWADYDDDGDADLVFTEEHGPNRFYRNNGNGTFTLMDPASFAIGNKTTASVGIAWEDFHNRGKLDLFIVNGRSGFRQNDFYYRNNGDGNFTALTSNQVGSVVTDASPGYGCAAADYDNDGDIDLFVANPGVGVGIAGPPEPNLLHRNNGDGTFSRIELGSLTSDRANSTSCVWGDYDNDGFMDLFVANGAWGGGFGGPQASFLYRNNGNSNRWIKLKLVGTVSNRSAVGTKVRVKATVAGKTIWQMRHVTSAGSYFAQNDARPHFGLGNATVVETVRIEWPSGIVQELHNVPANQILTVTEPAKLEPYVAQANGLDELKLKSWKGFAYDIEASSDLKAWTRLTTLTNETGTLSFADPTVATVSPRFYRVLSR